LHRQQTEKDEQNVEFAAPGKISADGLAGAMFQVQSRFLLIFNSYNPTSYVSSNQYPL